ncbi:uncharacterized protein [Euwallacea fornicatus]|uniref:uncharacterized protein n=1 Tax=Euwallacea fornicatus TaxID=995702 RepID=UPI00338D4A64
MLSGSWIKYIWITGFIYMTYAIPHQHSSSSIWEDIHDVRVYDAVVKSMRVWQAKQDAKQLTNRTKREEPTVCYDELGCFESSGPYGYIDMLPSKPEEINTKFLLYPARTRQRRSGSAPTEVPYDKLEEAYQWAKGGFNKSLPTKVLIHGFGSDCGYIWAYEIRSALMAVEEINTICVDWSNGAALPNYVKASANTRLVGKQLSLLLRGLVDKNGLSLMNTHLIGFSLGAHIAGFAGADLGNLSRITGLDPAGPLFEAQDIRARLDETDASFVDVIHSNGENLILGGLGSSQQMGHVDFYPNGGRMQKGCSHLFVGAVSDIIWSSAVEGRSLCNHRRAYKFFIDSVSPRCHFPAFPCDSYENFLSGKCFPCTDEGKCGNMGYYADRSKGRGELYLITREEEPFCAHQYLVKIETSSGAVPVKSYGKIQVTLIGESFLNETFVLTKKDDEEMKLGNSLSKIVVLHPLLSQPTKIQILYTAYSGWLSSGLAQWKVDKVTLMDSFGKVSSICKKNLVLRSGIPITLPLLPKDCADSISSSTETSEESKLDQAETVHSGYLDNKISMEESSNSLDGETESSRAFNSRPLKADKLNKNDGDGLLREVVEPILKTHSVKNGRAHVLNHDESKSEITEPILGPTTMKPKEEDWKRRDEAKSMKEFVQPPSQPGSNPLDAIVSTVQFLPQRLARMFEQAEKYARETILPLVSTYTPRFISDFIGPKPEPKYVPLHYEEPLEDPHHRPRSLPDQSKESSKENLVVSSSSYLANVVETTTQYSHIQRITKKIGIRAEGLEQTTMSSSSSTEEVSERAASTPSPSFNPTNLTSNFSNAAPQFSFNIDYDLPQKAQRRTSSQSPPPNNRTLIQTLASSIQNIPDNFAKMLVQVQDYTRRNIWPLVETSRRFSDLIWIRPNNSLRVNRTKINSDRLQEQNVSLKWELSRDSNEVVTTEVPKYAPTTSRTVQTSSTTEEFSAQLSTFSTSTSTEADQFKSNTEESSAPVSTETDKSTTPELIETSEAEAAITQIDEFLTTKKTFKTDLQEHPSTISPQTSAISLAPPHSRHIQRIPKRGQKSNIIIPQPFTIIIDPNDLTTTTTPPPVTTTAAPRPFQSFIQKIPRKKILEKHHYKVARRHPWAKDFRIGEKVVNVHSRFGGQVRYRIGADGRFEV